MTFFLLYGIKKWIYLHSWGSDPWRWPPLSSYLCSVMFTTDQSWRANAPGYTVGEGRKKRESGSLWWVRGWYPRCMLVLASLHLGWETQIHMHDPAVKQSLLQTKLKMKIDLTWVQNKCSQMKWSYVLILFTNPPCCESLMPPNVILRNLSICLGLYTTKQIIY